MRMSVDKKHQAHQQHMLLLPLYWKCLLLQANFGASTSSHRYWFKSLEFWFHHLKIVAAIAIQVVAQSKSVGSHIVNQIWYYKKSSLQNCESVSKPAYSLILTGNDEASQDPSHMLQISMWNNTSKQCNYLESRIRCQPLSYSLVMILQLRLQDMQELILQCGSHYQQPSRISTPFQGGKCVHEKHPLEEHC